MYTRQELEEYLFSQPTKYIKSAIPTDTERVFDVFDKRFREVLWTLLLSDHPISICALNARGLLIKKENGGRPYQVKNNELFISKLFLFTNRFFFEYIPPIYILMIIDKISGLPKLYNYFYKTLEYSAITFDYKPSIRKRGLKYKPTFRNCGNFLKSQVNDLTNFLKETSAYEMPMYNADRKLSEKVLVEALHDCFKEACDNIKKKDIFYSIAKMTLCFNAIHQEIRNSNSFDTSSTLTFDTSSILTEKGRVERSYNRYIELKPKLLSQVAI
jgi:hypothetical protein